MKDTQSYDSNKALSEKANNKQKTSGMIIASFILSILALIFCVIQAPQIGLTLVAIAIGLLIPEIIKAIKNRSLPKKGTGKFIAGCIMSIVALFIGVKTIIGWSARSAKIEQEYSKLEQLDLNGVVVNEACEKIRGAGWQILEVAGENNYTTKSDCSDSEHKVVSIKYHNEKYSSLYGSGSVDSRYEKVTLYFNDPSSSSNSSSSTSNNSGSSSNSSSSSSNNSSSGSSSSSNSGSSSSISTTPSSNDNNSSSSTNASFRKVMADYENFMNKYVDFMKKYKNSSDTMSMLSEYSSMMQDYAKFADSIKGYNQDNLSASDWAYYLEVTTRVLKKLAEVQ